MTDSASLTRRGALHFADQRGLLLVEILVAAGIAAVIASLLFQSVAAHARYRNRFQNELQRLRAAATIEALTMEICRSSQELFGVLEPRISQNELRDLENRRVTLRRQLQIDSHTISFPTFDGAAMQHREHLDDTSFCGDRAGSRSRQSALIFAGNSYRLQRVAARQSRCSLEAQCPCRSRYEQQLDDAQALLPLQDVLAYYVSSSGVLRRRSLLSSNDQPVLYDLKALQFEVQEFGRERMLRSRFRLLPQSEWQYIGCSLGPRVGHLLEVSL